MLLMQHIHHLHPHRCFHLYRCCHRLYGISQNSWFSYFWLFEIRQTNWFGSFGCFATCTTCATCATVQHAQHVYMSKTTITLNHYMFSCWRSNMYECSSCQDNIYHIKTTYQARTIFDRLQHSAYQYLERRQDPVSTHQQRNDDFSRFKDENARLQASTISGLQTVHLIKIC